MEKSARAHIPYNVDEGRSALVALRDEFEQQLCAGLRQRDEAQLVDDQQPVVGELLLQPQQSSFVACLHEFVHERRDGDEAHRQPLLARGQSQPQSGVSLARTRWAQSDHVLAPFDPLTPGELEDLDLVHRGDGLELEAVQALGSGELRRLDAPLNETPFAVNEFEFDQPRQELDVVQALVRRLARHLLVLAKGCRELEGLEPMLEQDPGRLAHCAPADIRHR